jgi:flagellar hook-associated protein 3 FlgL
MITNLDPASELFIVNAERIQQRLAEANRQVSSGKRVDQPSDAPDQIDSILQLRSDREHNAQIRANLSMALTDAQSADEALSACIRLLDRVLVLAGQAAGTVLDSTGRRTLAGEAQALLEQMVAYSQTALQDRHIFSGDQVGDPAYQIDPANPAAVLRLSTAPATRRIENPAGGSFAAGKSAQEIFDSRNLDDTLAADNVFGAVIAVRDALLLGDPAASAASVGAVKAASTHLNNMQSFYGTVQTRIRDAASFAERYDTELRKQIGQKEDADIAAAALEAAQAGTQLQAAFQMRALLPRHSLFDFLG